jgi:lauroyl/myristoyl acyltransferase
MIDASLRDYAPSGDESADVRDLTQRIVAALEGPIAQHPDQWFIFRPLWRASEPRAIASRQAKAAG